MDNIKNKMVKGAAWVALEKFSLQAVSFLVTLVLARLLTPTDYGTVALLAIFISIASTLVDAGFGEALVQKKDASDLDFNTVFYFSTALSGVLYLILFFSAPSVASFYKIPELCPILRVVSFTIIFNAVNSVQNAELSRKLKFNLSFRITCCSSMVSAAIGIVLAFMGSGPWALVWQSFSGSLVSVLLAWHFIHWRPQLMFSFGSLKNLFKFGWKLAFSMLLDSAMRNLSGAIIGKYYTRADLGFVDKGRVLPLAAVSAVSGSLERVTFPVFSQMQDDVERLRAMMRKIIRVSTFVVFPLMTGCAICADRLILLLFGEQWLPAIPYMRLMCVQFALSPFSSVNLRAILALGRSDMFLKLEIIKKVIGFSLMFLSLPHGVFCFVFVSALVAGPLGTLVNCWPNRKLLGYPILEQVKDVLPNLAVSLAMGGVCFGIGYCMPTSGWWASAAGLIAQFFAGVISYLGLAIVFKSSVLNEFVILFSPYLPKWFSSKVGGLFR